MSPLNDNQVRRVLVTFGQVDELLDDVERLARAEPTALGRERADFAPDEARLMLSAVALARSRVLEALDRLHIARPESTASARWSARTNLAYADIALSDLTVANLRGYGAVDAEAADDLIALAADLRTIIARARALLLEHDPGGLRERVLAVQGVPGEVLRALDQLSADHGLSALRPLIAAAADRANALTFDVGVFGRVSAGKSSLINALVGGNVLPVGSTPVTAVPVRITHGQPAAELFMLDGSSAAITIAEIAGYATEALNPGNRKGVGSVAIAFPGVQPGLRLLDTPGVGSLSTSGPAQAFAWLPRCDLGLVLIAAGTALGRDDLALISGLANAGIAQRVLLSKADTLSVDERMKAEEYLRRELNQTLGPGHAIDVRPVSALPNLPISADALRGDLLEALARDHARSTAVALKQRLHRLAALANEEMRGVRPPPPRLESYKAHAAAAEAIRLETDRFASHTGAWTDAAADAVAVAWANKSSGTAAARASLLASAARALTALRVLADGARGTAVEEPARTSRRIPPLFDPELLDTLPGLDPPRIGRLRFGRAIARRRLESIEAPLRDALARYSQRLFAWGMGVLDESAETERAAPATVAPADADLARLDTLIDSL